MALAQADIASYAFNGTEMFGNKIGNLRAVAVLYPQFVQWVMDPDIIYTMEGIKGAQIAVGPAGSGSEANTRQILDANGITYKDLVKALFLSSSEAVDAFNTGQIHGFCLTDGVPSPAVTEATNTRKIRMLPITGEAAQKVTARYRLFTPGTIPAQSYKGLTEAVPTLSVRAVLVVRQELDEKLVYWLTRTLVEKQPELAQAHPLGKEVSKATVAADSPIPLHPGAERYYKETAVLK
jgi:TRAP transporter TAXI family solute receptor